MSRSRGRSSNSVSLFPFLAVLVCAMGSLIFLLIVTTRQIRSESVAKHLAKRQAGVGETHVALGDAAQDGGTKPANPRTKTSPSAGAHRTDSGLCGTGSGASHSRFAAGQSHSAAPFGAGTKTDLARRYRPEAESAGSQRQTPAQIQELEAARQGWLDLVRKKEQTVAKLQADVDVLTLKLKTINSQIEAVAKNRSANSDAQRQLLITQNQMLGQLAKIEQQLDEARKLANGSATKFQVVPFDGQTGTNYRPIIIECTGAGMRFVPEDVLLTQEDFDGFTLGKNPLLSGAKAISDYWTKVSVRSGGSEPEPYVLLIVRPSGSKYYAARQLLDALDRPFGYELVEENLPIEIPPRDPVAAELCRTAVEAVLREREDFKKLLASHGPEILSRNPNYRVKRKPEGGFEVEYAPDGKFAEDGFGARSRIAARWES